MTPQEMFNDVRPKTGPLARALEAISNPRKRRWKSYERACRRIPKDSPIHGTTSWDKINDRRHALIDAEIKARGPFIKGRKFKRSAELQALQDICGEVMAGSLVAQNFLMGRILRRLRKKYPTK